MTRRWPAVGRGRLAGARRAGAGVLDQAIIALANAGNTLLAAALLPRDRSSDLLLAAAVAYFAIGINRAFVGDVLLTLAPRHEGERRTTLIRDGLATALCAGLAGGLVFVGIWAVRPGWEGIDLGDLIWLAPFLPLILAHDTGRYSYLAARQPARALVVDLVWVGTQAAAITVFLLVWGPTAGGLLTAWGLGATAGFTVFLVRERPAIHRGSPRAWTVQTRHLAGWFTATALIGQFQTLAVGFLVSGQLSRTALSGLRTAQTAILQPVQNFQLAVQGLLVPRLSRLAGQAAGDAAGADDGVTPAEAAVRLRRQVRQVSWAFCALAAVTVAVFWPVGSLVLTHIPKFADIAPLALPISLQAGIYLVQVPFTAALRGMHQARLLFAQYAVFTTVSLTGLVIGAAQGGLVGAVWGLVTGAAAGLTVMIGLYLHAAPTRRVGTAHEGAVPVSHDRR